MLLACSPANCAHQKAGSSCSTQTQGASSSRLRFLSTAAPLSQLTAIASPSSNKTAFRFFRFRDLVSESPPLTAAVPSNMNHDLSASDEVRFNAAVLGAVVAPQVPRW